MRGNAIEITLGYGRVGQTGNLFQYDKGQHLIINGCPLPNAYEVHFSNDTLGKSKTMLGNPEGVDIPDEYLESGEDIHVWVYIVGEDHSETEYHGVIYVTKRAEPTDETPTPSQQSVIDQTIAALNSAVTDVEHAVDTVDNKIDEALAEAKASGEFDGHTPEKGVDYWTNSDKQEITQYVSGELIDDTAGAGVTGKTWSANKIVQTLDNIPLIDDTAGAGVTDKAWSANKLTEELSEKAPVENPAFSGTFKTGEGTISNGPNAVVFGEYNVEDNLNRWPEWKPGRYNVGDKVKRTVNGKASGWICNTANTDSVFLERKWDYQGTRFNFAEIVGNGVEEKPSNARATDWQGNGFYKGDVYVGCNDNSTGGEKLPRSADVNELIQNAIRNIKSFEVEIVNHLPSPGDARVNVLYFVRKTGSYGDFCDEYMWINNAWELVGKTDLDLSTKADKDNTVITSSLSMNRRGDSTVGPNSVALGNNNTASADNTFAVGYGVSATGSCAHAEGYDTTASGSTSHAEGTSSTASGVQSHAEGLLTVASGPQSHAEGNTSSATSGQSHAEGYGTLASGYQAHAEGYQTISSGAQSHAEGEGGYYQEDHVMYYPAASGASSHVEGRQTLASGDWSHAEGYRTKANGYSSHAEGFETSITSDANNAHAEGCGTIVSGPQAHAEGYGTTASADEAHAEGYETTASGYYSHAEGSQTVATASSAHAEGSYTTASGLQSHAEGDETTASGQQSHAEGAHTTASANQSHAEGSYTTASGYQSHAEGIGGAYTINDTTYTSEAKGTADHTEGYQTRTAAAQPGNHAEGYMTAALGGASHAEGCQTTASGNHSHAEGYYTTASGAQSHAEGNYTTASGLQSHAEGYNTTASNYQSHAEGSGTTASGPQSHAEGSGNTASGMSSHAEGAGNTASGNYSHVGGSGNIASGAYSNVFGKCNIADSQENISDLEEWAPNVSYNVGDVRKRTTTSNGSTVITKIICNTANSDSSYNSSKWYSVDGEYKYIEIVGNGFDNSHRSNARTLDWNGNEELAGSLTLNGSISSGRKANTTVGLNSFAVGYSTTASGGQAHAEGAGTTASGQQAHAEGAGTTASGAQSHAEGDITIASGVYSHAEGLGGTYTKDGTTYTSEAKGTADHTEGYQTRTASGQPGNHAEGYQTAALGGASHAEGAYTTASGSQSHVEGNATTASGAQSHAEGLGGTYTKDGTTYTSEAKGVADHTEGYQTRTASNQPGNHAEGYQTAALGGASHAEGAYTTASGSQSHAEGNTTTASGGYSHAEGSSTTASGACSHAEGNYTKAEAEASHAEGAASKATGIYSHAEGQAVTASGVSSHAEGTATTAIGASSHAEGTSTTANGEASHAEGIGTAAKHLAQHVEGMFNVADPSSAAANAFGTYVEIIGNGTSNNARSNARTLDWNGNEVLKGDLTINAGSQYEISVGGLRSMFGSNETNLGYASQAYAIGQTFTMDGKLYKATATIAQNDVITPGTNCAETTVDASTVHDVLINNSSILQNGVASIPIAGTNVLGAVMVQSGYGLSVSQTGNSAGRISTDRATVGMIKAGTDQYRPITPYTQQDSIFYGLSKLAGVDLANETVTVGTYPATSLAAIQAMLGIIGDVQINGTSIAQNGVATIPICSSSTFGVVKVDANSFGIKINNEGKLYTDAPNINEMKAGTQGYKPIVPSVQHTSVFYGLAKAAGDTSQASSSDAVGTYTESAKTAIRNMLGVETGTTLVETVSGSVVSITAQPNVRYNCGEVSTISITPPSAGTCDIFFTSGSTAAVLTVPNTVKFPVWFDATALSTNTIYEIMITDGVYGSVMSWAS